LQYVFFKEVHAGLQKKLGDQDVLVAPQ